MVVALAYMPAMLLAFCTVGCAFTAVGALLQTGGLLKATTAAERHECVKNLRLQWVILRLGIPATLVAYLVGGYVGHW